ncbi:YfiR family protein [Desulfoplanes formicivorans]|uniref:YfiR family protein n=1 Tax=Desulfoplanes formicivorans TaxID=1592317 RepID=UPI0009F193D0|nr:YfiR family protein [Desulfoplanes formicivorans]
MTNPPNTTQLKESPPFTYGRLWLPKAPVWFVLIAGICLLLTRPLAAEQSGFDENQIKSIFIYNLTYFVFWDMKRLGPPSTPFRILNLGDQTMQHSLEKAVQGESVQNHHLHVDSVPMHPLHAYQIIFVPSNKTFRTKQLLQEIHGHQTLLVGESIDFLEKGGMIAFIRNGKKINIYLNMNALIKANILISSKLYRVSIPFNNDKENTSW